MKIEDIIKKRLKKAKLNEEINKIATRRKRGFYWWGYQDGLEYVLGVLENMKIAKEHKSK